MSVLIPSLRPAIAVPGWAKNELWRRARAVPSLDLRFADNKSLVDATTGASLMTFTRASSGTYVDSQGVIRNAVTNLWTYSEQFEVADWAKTRCSISTNTVEAPNGTLTADTLIEDNTASATHQTTRAASVIAGLPYTWSIYCKTAGRSHITLSFANQFPANSFADFNLSAGTIASTGALGASNVRIQPIGDGWHRLSITATASSTATSSLVAYMNNGTSISYTGDGTSGIYLWGAQLEQSTTPGEYVKTTSIISGAPRFGHDPETGESLGLMIEEQRTNLLTNSEDFDAGWAKSNSAVTSDSTTAPDGTTTADLVAATGATDSINRVVTVSSGAVVTLSMYIKRSNMDWVRLTFLNGANEVRAWFNVATGELGTVEATGTATSAAGSITSTGNGWYRCSLTGAIPSQTSYALFNVTAAADASFTRVSGGERYLWGAQLEEGSSPTSYIKTEAATVTRNDDVAQITGSNFSRWYSQSQGTMFAEGAFVQAGPTNFPRLASLTGTNAGLDEISIYSRIGVGSGNGSIFGAITVNGSLEGDLAAPTDSPDLSSAYRSALAYRANDFSISSNGLTPIVDNSGSLPPIAQLVIMGKVRFQNRPTGYIRRLAYWPARLPDSTLQAITQ